MTWRHFQFFFDLVLFLLSGLVTGPISSLILQLWQFPFIRDWPEIRKSEIPVFEFCPISTDWDDLGIPNLAKTSLVICYWMLQNARVTAFTVSELLREKQQGTEEGGNFPPTTQIRNNITRLSAKIPFESYW